LPSKKRSRRKPVPLILRTPIEHSELEEEMSSSPAIARQINDRMRAVFEYYGVDRESPTGATKLVGLMARERFPAAFRRVLKGTPKTKKPKWDFFARSLLVKIFEGSLLQGKSQEEAAQLCIGIWPQRSSWQGMVAEYYRAKRWLLEHKPSDLERRNFAERMAEIQSDIRRGK
jgi:hypothetical protein